MDKYPDDTQDSREARAIDAPNDSVNLRQPRARRRESRTPQQARERRRRLLTYAVMVGATIFTVNALVGDNGYLASRSERLEADAIAADTARIEKENASFEEQAQRLKSDPSAIEEAARKDLRLIKPGEKLVIISDVRPAAAAAKPSTPR